MHPTTETRALKEWAVAVDALARGETILLLRKGGIREEGKHFRVAHDEVLLYPTYEHQQPELLKPAYAAQVTPVASGWHPATVPITAWARITHIFQVRELPTVEALLPFHIWNERFAAERFGWKPRFPLWLLLLRVYRLPTAQTVAYRAEYGGCKSWIELHEPVALRGLQPALDDAAYARQVEQIRAIAEREPVAVD
ncbi:DUF1802 family protein [Kallotenue papyrolyticum]|uniref:DUF1802 family protein n=1 Tax=Kallotenue papyrolyticum TaxID=1325125 RepID=UPI00046F1816|nr:DUF1802 family protein [Kallotenue papyrolyticum]